MYSKEFKKHALEVSDEIGTKQACAQLGIPYGTLINWRKPVNRLEIEGETTKGKKDTYTKEDVAALVKENEELQKSMKILKDALSFLNED